MKLNFLKSKREKTIFWSITALGISSIVTQLVLMREFLNIFYGNEIIFGIILGNWLLLTGIGAYLGKYIEKIKRKFILLIFSQIAIALLPFFTIFLIRILRNTIFLPGELINVFHIFSYSFILLLPYCLISGYLLTLACIVFSKKKDEEAIGKVYFIDNIGDILGGVLFSFVLIYFLNPFQMALFIFIINLLAAILVSRFIRKPNLTIFILALLISSTIFFFIFDLDKISTEIMFKEQNIIYQKNSLYGNLVVTKSYGQLNFFENSVPLFSTNNTIANEEVVHYAMVQHKNPRNVLLISGGVSGTALEILKYNVSRIDYVEIDPLITEIGRDFTKNLDDPRINVFNLDGRLFVKTTNTRYDVVIIDLPDPSTAQLNRFYTEEFFSELKNILNAEGIISLSITSSENYMSEEVKKLNSAVYKTLKEKFSNIIIIPGGKNFFIASEGVLYYNISERIEDKNITTAYVNKYYLYGKLTPDRINYVLDSIKEDVEIVPINRDLSPVAYYYHLLYFFSYFKINYQLFLIIFSIILITVILILSLSRFKRENAVPFAIFTTGFAAASLEVVLLIGFQILYGYTYHMIGFIVTAFMIGLAAGAFYMNINLKKRKISDIIKIEFIIFIYSIMLPVLLILLNNLKSETLILISAVLFPVMALLVGILVGAEFPLAAKLHFRNVAKTAGTLYFSDLFGACIGAFAVGALLIPLLGLVNVCIIIGIMNLVSGLLVFMFRKNWI